MSMIAFLTGRPEVIQDELIIHVNGVGYGVKVSSRVLMAVQDEEELSLHIYSHIREDRFELYGFPTRQELELFKLVIGVSGVGPATALNLMDKDPDKLVEAVQEANTSFFKSVPRVGKKLAQKIIIELRGKLGELKELNLAPLSAAQRTVAEALESLGMDQDQIENAVQELDLTDLNESQAIKKALQKFG